MTEYNMVGLGLIFLGHSLWSLNLCDNKWNKRVSESLYCIVAVLATILCIHLGFVYGKDINQKVTIVFFAAFVIVSAAFFLMSKGPFFKKAFLIFTYYIFFCITHNLSYLIASRLIPRTEELYYLVGITIRTVLHVGALIPYVWWMKKRF